MILDPLILSRMQMGWTLAFHILYPSLSIGLGAFILVMETLWIKTRNPEYLRQCKFWVKIFALTFGMGVVSGIVLSFELGLNWSGYTKQVGPVLGAFFTMEVLTSFFLEAGFLGIMLYGWNKVGPRLHYFATLMVVVGTWFSAFWILVANSWMQTPAGYSYVNAVFNVANWWQVIFTPSLPYRFFHMLFAAWEASFFIVIGISAWYLLKGIHTEFAKRSFAIAFVLAVIIAIIQPLVGDQSALEVAEHQPIKLAAIESLWNTESSVPELLVAWPDASQQKNTFEIGIPYLASLMVTHSLHGTIQGLNTVPASDQPYVPIVFYSFRVMVAIGLLLLAIALWGAYLKLRGQIYQNRLFLRSCVLVAPLGFVAIICGWLTAESGRQPWVVYGLLRTQDSLSAITWYQVFISLSLIVVVYVGVFGAYLYYSFKVIRQGPTALVPVEKRLPGDTEMQSPLISKE